MKAGWQVKALGEVAEIVNGGTPKSEVAEYWDGDIDWLTPKDMGKLDGHLVGQTPRRISRAGLAKCSARQVPENSVIMSTRAPIGHLAMNTVPMAFNQGCRGMVPTSQLDAKFLFYVLGANVQALDDLGTGTTFKELSAGVLKAFPIPLPPLAEQKQIVAVLDAAFAGLSRARAHVLANLNSARELFESYLGEVFKNDDRGWQTAQLGQIVSQDCTLSYGIVQPGDEVEGGLLIVRPTDLGPRTIDAEGLKRIDPALAESYRRTTLKGGDLLLCVRGTTGTVAIAADELAGANVTRGIVPVRFDPLKVSQELGYYLFCSRGVKEQIKAGTYGTALMQINIGDLRKIVMHFPPLTKQREIITHLNAAEQACGQLQSHYRAKLADLDALRAALLQKAFAGELT